METLLTIIITLVMVVFGFAAYIMAHNKDRQEVILLARPKKYNSVEEMQQLINDYFNYCDENKKPYTVSGLANALDLTRQSLLNYAEDDEFSIHYRREIKSENVYIEELL